MRLAYQLRQQGMTYKMIARKTGISERTQQRRFKGLLNANNQKLYKMEFKNK